MKKQTLLISFLLLFSLFACEKEDSCYCEAPDNKAMLMEQVGGIFEPIARNPETYDTQVKITSELYSDIAELLPISDKAVQQRGKARGHSFGLLFYALSRNPGAFDKLDAAATKFLGAYDKSVINEEMEEISKAYAIARLNEAYARNPGTDSLLNVLSKKYLNFKFDTE